MQRLKKTYLVAVKALLVQMIVILFGYQSIAKTSDEGASPKLFLYSLADNWLTYNHKLGDYVPYFRNIYPNVNKLYLELAKNQYNGFYLSMYGKKGDYLFLENRLSYEFEKDQWISFSVDSLQRLSARPSLLLTYYSNEDLASLPKTYVTVDRYSEKAMPSVEPHPTNAHRKRENPSGNFLNLLALVVLGVTALVSVTQQPIFNLSVMLRSLDSFIKGKNQIKRIQVVPFFLFLAYYSLVYSFGISLLHTHTSAESSDWLSLTQNSLWNLTGDFSALLLSVASFVIVKYLSISLMGILYHDRHILNLHFQEYMTSSYIFSVLAQLAILLTNTRAQFLTPDIGDLSYVMIACMALPSLFLTYRLNKSVSYRKIYLFSYLCTTEYLPLLLFIKFFITL